MVKRKKKSSSAKPKSDWGWHPTPLKGSFMVLAILGFLITAYLVYPLSFNYGLAFMIVFLAMFIASLVSMTKAPVIEK